MGRDPSDPTVNVGGRRGIYIYTFNCIIIHRGEDGCWKEDLARPWDCPFSR